MVVFNYIDRTQGIDHNFGVNLKKYLAHQQIDLLLDQVFDDEKQLSDEDKLDRIMSEGVYTFLPDWNQT